MTKYKVQVLPAQKALALERLCLSPCPHDAARGQRQGGDADAPASLAHPLGHLSFVSAAFRVVRVRVRPLGTAMRLGMLQRTLGRTTRAREVSQRGELGLTLTQRPGALAPTHAAGEVHGEVSGAEVGQWREEARREHLQPHALEAATEPVQAADHMRPGCNRMRPGCNRMCAGWRRKAGTEKLCDPCIAAAHGGACCRAHSRARAASAAGCSRASRAAGTPASAVSLDKQWCMAKVCSSRQEAAPPRPGSMIMPALSPAGAS